MTPLRRSCATFFKALATGFLGTFLGLQIGHAADWPQFRGPSRDGVWSETGILKTFPADGLKIKWKRPVGGGWPSPVVSQGKVFVFDVELIKPVARERLHCFDEKTGKVLWVYSYEQQYGEWAYDPERGAQVIGWAKGFLERSGRNTRWLRCLAVLHR